MHEAQEKKSAGTVRQTGSVPAEVPRGVNAIPAPRGIWWRDGRRNRHQGEHREGGASFRGLRVLGRLIYATSRETNFKELESADFSARTFLDISRKIKTGISLT